jgi:Ig domain of plant-specific actin-binding protein
MTRKLLQRLLAAAATVAVLVAALTVFAGSGVAAQGSAAAANYAPTNSAAPTISGTSQAGQTLTANPGTWTSDTTPTYSYQWQRCNAQGQSCVVISGATAQTYAVQTADVGSTIRVVVSATNPSGSSSATSAQTAVVSQPGPAGAIQLQNGKTSIPASSVSLPERLIIDGVQFTPSRLTSRAAFTARIHVSDTRGYVVRDVLVLVTGLPYAWARTGAEVRTDQNGWATMTITPTSNMPVGRSNALVMFVRARVEGQDLLAGSSSRRLVQVGIR